MSRAVDAGKGAEALGTIAAVKWTGKVVGGLLGMLTLGPLGAAVGVLVELMPEQHAHGCAERAQSEHAQQAAHDFACPFHRRTRGHVGAAAESAADPRRDR